MMSHSAALSEWQRADALLSLLQLIKCRPASPISSASPADLSSPAASCAVDPLCLIFSTLPARDFLAAQQCCRSWHAVRLQPASWPCNRGSRWLAMLQRADEEAQLRAAEQMRKLFTSCGIGRAIQHIAATPGLIERLVALLESTQNAALQVRLSCTRCSLTAVDACYSSWRILTRDCDPSHHVYSMTAHGFSAALPASHRNARCRLLRREHFHRSCSCSNRKAMM